MSVIRVSHQKNYVVINKTVLEDKNLSFKAKGLWAYCMSRPNDWTFHVSQLITVSSDGKESIYSALKELENQGYLTKIQCREKGKFKEFDYEISEIQIILPLTGKPDTVKPDTENPPLLSNECLPSIEKEEVVCYPDAVTPEIERPLSKEELKKISVDEAIKALELPLTLSKQTPEGKEIQISLEQMFAKSVSSKKDWKTSEIHKAWEILANYSGAVRDPFRFVEGTIDNLRNKNKSEFLKKKGDAKCNSETGKIYQQPKEDKLQSSANVTEERPSLQSLLEKAGLL